MLTVPPLWPMTTRVRSTPSSLKMRCCSSPHGSGGVGVWVVMGTPVARWACATARSTRSTPGVMPGRSDAHLRMPARTAGLADALADLADEDVDHRLGPAENGPRTLEVEVHRDFVVGVDTGGHDDVDLRHLFGDGRHPRDVATQSDHGEVDQRVDPVVLELAQLRHGAGLLGRLVPLLRRLLDLGAQHEDVLVHQGAPEVTSRRPVLARC